MDQESCIPILHQFIENQLQHYLTIADDLPKVNLPVEPLDELFQEMLAKVWSAA
jgi:hypothetical protein